MEATTGTVAGYAVIRRIGAGGRAEVLLGRLPTRPGTGGTREGALVALKLFRSRCDPAAIGLEVRALLAVPSALVGLRDVATTSDGRICLVTDHLAGPTLDRLLAARGRLGAGEVVTIAATVTATLQALHDVGLSQQVLRPTGVRFDDSGRPVLLGLGSLVELPDGAAGVQLRRDAAVGLSGFLRTLVGYLDPADTAAATVPELLTGFESQVLARPFPSSLAGLEAALFAWAPAGPVRGARPGPAAAGPGATPAARSLPAGQHAQAPEPAARSRRRAGRSTVGALLGRARAPLERLRALPRRLPPGRPLLVGLGLAAALVIAGLVVPAVVEPGPGGGSVTAGEQRPPATDPGASAAGPGVADDETGDDNDGDEAAVEGDDPAAAALVLMRLRAGCLAEASVLCLDGVDQPGSVAMAADGYLVRQRQSVPEPTAAPDWIPVTAQLRERTGDAALVALAGSADGGVNAQPASALVIKGEAGWRLRELFDY